MHSDNMASQRHVSTARVSPLVLLVDDNPDTLEMYALGLEYEGFEIAKAQDGKTALESVARQRPDCIVADVRMPRMTGLEFRRLLRRSGQTADIPVIALTGYSTDVELQTARAAGFESVLVKPCLPEALAREIARVLLEARAPRARARHSSARASHGMAKAARLQDQNADIARNHEKIRRTGPAPE